MSWNYRKELNNKMCNSFDNNILEKLEEIGINFDVECPFDENPSSEEMIKYDELVGEENE